MPGKYYWIKERHNPQFESSYYVACGQITAAMARDMERSLYGNNVMLRFDTKDQYEKKLSELRENGFSVY
jgi:hypothetical protein